MQEEEIQRGDFAENNREELKADGDQAHEVHVEDQNKQKEEVQVQPDQVQKSETSMESNGDSDLVQKSEQPPIQEDKLEQPEQEADQHNQPESEPMEIEEPVEQPHATTLILESLNKEESVSFTRPSNPNHDFDFEEEIPRRSNHETPDKSILDSNVNQQQPSGSKTAQGPSDDFSFY